MAAVFGALNRFISRLDADPASLNQNSYYPQQHQPDTTIGDNTWGFQVLRNKNAELPLEPWFDFIIGINGHAIDDPDPKLFATEVRNCAGGSVLLETWSAKGQRTHATHIPISPSNPILGLTLQFAPLSSTYNIWHVCSIPSPLSPAFTAGLLPHHDYILGTPSGTLRGESALQELVEDYLNTKLVLWVYNSEFDVVREVELVPRRGWGGEGVLGAELGFGVLHRLPAGLSEEVQEPGEALFDSKEGGEPAIANAGSNAENFIVPADTPFTMISTTAAVPTATTRTMSPDTPQSAGATTFTQQFAPSPKPTPTPPIAGAVPPPPKPGSAGPAGQAAFIPTATPATHSRAGRRQRHTHNTAEGLDEYFRESEKQSQEHDHALTKNTAPVPPPPKGKGGPDNIPADVSPPPSAAAPPKSAIKDAESPAVPSNTDAVAEATYHANGSETGEQHSHDD
ncbi:hypothetical protein KEM56_007268 [Ascosphaera pollenicola]|nr:hypothetical protein KEM56_007268 [Ascosphaera pollenicola]